jgi:hypothetical protein
MLDYYIPGAPELQTLIEQIDRRQFDAQAERRFQQDLARISPDAAVRMAALGAAKDPFRPVDRGELRYTWDEIQQGRARMRNTIARRIARDDAERKMPAYFRGARTISFNLAISGLKT